MQCKECVNAEFERTPTGRIKKEIAGKCLKQKDLMALAEACAAPCIRVTTTRYAIWPDTCATNCTYWKKETPMTTTPQAALLSEADMLDCLREATHEIPTRIPPGWRKVMQAAEKRILAKLQDGRNTPFGREAEKLADNYLDLQAQYADAVAKLQATQEPVHAGELPPLPHDGWPARFRCDSCDGNGEIGELISMGHFQPPERQTCPDCGGRGWSDEGPAFNADHMRDYARAVLSARKPLTVPDSMSHKAFFQAGAICHEMGYVSVAGVQRKLAIGWNEAKAICQHLHDTGSLAGLEMSPHINGIGLEVKP